MSNVFERSKVKALEETTEEFAAYSGCDMVVYMGHRRVAAIQGLTVSIVRELVPVYIAGRVGPANFIKGKRAISGNIVFTQFDRHALLKAAQAFRDKRKIEDLWDGKDYIVPVTVDDVFGKSSTNPKLAEIGNEWVDKLNAQMKTVKNLVGARPLRFSDQIPPFDITVTFVSEDQAVSSFGLFGVRLGNEAYGWTLDDVNSEMAATYVALDILPLDRHDKDNPNTVFALPSSVT